MRPLPILAALLALAVAARQAASGAAQGPFPAWALFSFAVSAFREPLR